LEQFSRIVLFVRAKVAVPYIPAFRSFSIVCNFYFYRKFKVSSAFAAIKVILPEKVLSGYTLATTLVVLYFNPAT
jgi:hypothetical protein